MPSLTEILSLDKNRLDPVQKKILPGGSLVAFIQDFYWSDHQLQYPAQRGGLSPGTWGASDGGSTLVSGLERRFPGRTDLVSSSAESALPIRDFKNQ